MIVPSLKSLVPAALLAGVAAAQTDGPYSVGVAPVGVTRGILNITLTCSVKAVGFLDLGDQEIFFGVSALLPNRVNVNQPFSVIAATRLVVPEKVNSLAYGFGARYYTGNVDTVIVNTTGATPPSTDVAKASTITIPPATINSKGVSVLEVPGNGKSLTVGPLVATTNGTVLISFGEISATVKTLDSNKKATFITAAVKCPAQKKPTHLAAIGVSGTDSTTPIVPTGNTAIQTVPLGATAGVTGFNYFCDFSGFVQGNIRVSLGAVKPSTAAVTSGSKFSLQQGQGNIILSAALVDSIKSIVSVADHVTLNLTTFNLVATNASPAKQNIIPKGGLAISNVPIKANAVVVVPPTAPATPLPDIVFKAGGKAGTPAIVSIADAAGNASLRDSDDNEILSIDFVCGAGAAPIPVLPWDVKGLLG